MKYFVTYEILHDLGGINHAVMFDNHKEAEELYIANTKAENTTNVVLHEAHSQTTTETKKRPAPIVPRTPRNFAVALLVFLAFPVLAPLCLVFFLVGFFSEYIHRAFLHGWRL